MNQTTSTVNFFPPGTSFDPTQEYTGDITLFIDNNNQNLSAQQYYDGINNEALFTDAHAVQQSAVNGLPAIRFGGITTAIVPTDVTVITLPNFFIRLEAVGSLAVFDAMFNSVAQQ